MAAQDPNPRTLFEKRKHLHRNLVLAELGITAACVWLMAETGFGFWTFSALGLAALLMITSMALQACGRVQGSREQTEIKRVSSLEKERQPILNALLPSHHHR